MIHQHDNKKNSLFFTALIFQKSLILFPNFLISLLYLARIFFQIFKSYISFNHPSRENKFQFI